MATTPPGWYDDGSGVVRWWDGSQWTEHVAPSTRASAPASTEWTAPSAHGDGTFPGDDRGYGSAHPTSYDSVWSATTSPGANASAGAVATAAPPQKSRMWIVWLVLGLGLAGIVVAVAVLAVSLITGGFAAPVVSSQPETTASAEAEEVEAEEPSAPAGTADEAAAVAAVEAFNQAWLDSDCDAYFASTTENFRTLVELTDCESFYSQSRSFAVSTTGYEITVGEVKPIGDSVSVSTTESYLGLYDEEGNELASPEQIVEQYEYLVVDEAGVWRVDDWFLEQ